MDGITDRFFRILVELAVRHCLVSESPPSAGSPGIMSFIAIDAFVRLTLCLVMGALTSTFHCQSVL
jgi:CCR4-NOT transcription complex subunit 1